MSYACLSYAGVLHNPALRCGRRGACTLGCSLAELGSSKILQGQVICLAPQQFLIEKAAKVYFRQQQCFPLIMSC